MINMSNEETEPAPAPPAKRKWQAMQEKGPSLPKGFHYDGDFAQVVLNLAGKIITTSVRVPHFISNDVNYFPYIARPTTTLLRCTLCGYEAKTQDGKSSKILRHFKVHMCHPEIVSFDHLPHDYIQRITKAWDDAVAGKLAAPRTTSSAARQLSIRASISGPVVRDPKLQQKAKQRASVYREGLSTFYL
jgi:hypothetical protein